MLRAPTTLEGCTRYQINATLHIFLSRPLMIFKYATAEVKGLIVHHLSNEPELSSCCNAEYMFLAVLIALNARGRQLKKVVI